MIRWHGGGLWAQQRPLAKGGRVASLGTNRHVPGWAVSVRVGTTSPTDSQMVAKGDTMEIQPFVVDVPQPLLDDLQERLATSSMHVAVVPPRCPSLSRTAGRVLYE
jgi:hypothetical protein